MENPATWTKAAKVIDKAWQEWNELQAQEVIGASLPSYLSDALEKAGLLNEYGSIRDHNFVPE